MTLSGDSFIRCISAADTSTVLLPYCPPYDWTAMLEFLGAHRVKDVEWFAQGGYFRTVRLGRCTGWVAVRHAPEQHALRVEFTYSLAPVLPALLGRLRNLFDLSARPDPIAAHLMQDELLHKSVARNPGLRVPGAFDGFELAVRSILGQQVTVKAATTLSCRFAEAFGEKIATPFPELSRLPPLPGRVANADLGSIARLGIISARAGSIIALAQACARGQLMLEVGAHPEAVIEQLVGLPGIGRWTAHSIAMRALRWPDAFPKEDIAVRACLGGVTARRAEEMSQAWRPWRSYAVMHLWNNRPQAAKRLVKKTRAAIVANEGQSVAAALSSMEIIKRK